jgi:serine/threonine-protein phosphatase 2A regulatory subunit A
MITELYVLLNDADKAILREIYGRLCRDELPIVRRAGSLAFQNFCKLVDSEILSNEFLTLLKTILADESQVIQVIGVENLASYSTLLKKCNATAILSNEILPMVKNYSDDHSWRTRQSLVKGFGQFALVFLPAEVSSEVLTSLGHMALDPEPDVRTLAVQEFAPFLDVVGSTQFIAEFAPVAQQLVEDPVNQVRKLLSEICVDILGKVGPEIVSAHLSDLIIKFMNDEDPLVRLRIIKKLNIVAEESESLCTRLTENLKSMFNHSNWRLRKGLVEAMPSVVQHMGPDYFVDHFLNHSLLLVKDGVEEVRIASCEALAKIAAISDINWVYERIFPTFKSLANEDYLTRLTMMTALERFLALENVQDRFQSECVAQIISMSTDKVPNVRLRAAQALHYSLASASSSNHLGLLKDQLLSALNDLQNDKDKDVRYFATHAKLSA